ncbi:hypothetical protein FRC09_014379 [Ceratobasidium sp. 395]|nr:hypothetical protein FRC09_014379 [Ceratobasidium sp. 395]
MTPERVSGDKRRFHRRRCLKEIQLEPDKSVYEITIELQVDGVTAHKLPQMKKGQQLHWDQICLPCDVSDDSTITLHVTEVHLLAARSRVGIASCQASQLTNQGEVSIGCENNMFAIKMTFLGEEEAKQAYLEAFQKVKHMENQPGLLEKAGKIGSAFKALLDLGSLMASLDPTGGAEVAFSVCTKAWEHLEQQEKQDTELNELVKRLARMIPSVESIKGLADNNLKETVMDMLNLIEDMSLFILNTRPRGSFERAWRAAISSEIQEQSEAYIAKFKELRREFDSRVGVQALRAAEIESEYIGPQTNDIDGT